MKTIEFRVPRARNTSSFVVYPWSQGDKRYKLQNGNHCIIVDIEKEVMLVSKRFNQYPTFEYCNPELGGKLLRLSEDVKDQLEAITLSGHGVKSLDGTVTLVG